MKFRHRLMTGPDGSTAIAKDIPDKIEISVIGASDEGIELTEAEHDALAAGMTNAGNINAKVQAIKKAKR